MFNFRCAYLYRRCINFATETQPNFELKAWHKHLLNSPRCHDTQPNGIQHKDTGRKYTKHHNLAECPVVIVVMLNVVMLIVVALFLALAFVSLHFFPLFMLNAAET